MSLNFELNRGTTRDTPSTLALRFTEEIEGAFPVSPTQAGMLFHSLFAPQAGLYLEQIILRIDGDLNVQLFESSWQRVVDHHQILRTSFRSEGLDNPLQIVHRQVTLPFQQHDWRELTSAEQDSRLENFVRVDREAGFDFSQPPLMRLALVRLAADSYRLIWTNHHTLLDGWSQSLILKQVFSVYRTLAAGEEPSLEPSPSYRNYVDWLAVQDSTEAERFWKQALKGFTAPTSLVVDRFTDLSTIASRSEVVRHEELELRLPVRATAELRAFARQLFHPIHVAHLVGTPDQRNRLRSQPLNLQQLQHRRVILLEQVGLHAEAAVLEQLLQIDQHAFADAGDSEHFLGFGDDVFDLLGMIFHSLGCVAVGANAERILTVDFEQVGGFVKNVGDGFVVHGLKLNQDQGGVPASREGGSLERQGFHSAGSSDRPSQFGSWSKRSFQALLLTLAACGPFWPSLISNSTVSPSWRLLYPSEVIAL